MVSVIAMFCCMHLKAGVQSSYDFHNARSCVSSCRAHFIASFFFSSSLLVEKKFTTTQCFTLILMLGILA